MSVIPEIGQTNQHTHTHFFEFCFGAIFFFLLFSMFWTPDYSLKYKKLKSESFAPAPDTACSNEKREGNSHNNWPLK